MRPVSVVSDRNEGKGGTPNCGQARYQPGAGRADLLALSDPSGSGYGRHYEPTVIVPFAILVYHRKNEPVYCTPPGERIRNGGGKPGAPAAVPHETQFEKAASRREGKIFWLSAGRAERCGYGIFGYGKTASGV